MVASFKNGAFILVQLKKIKIITNKTTSHNWIATILRRFYSLFFSVSPSVLFFLFVYFAKRCFLCIFISCFELIAYY